MSCQDVRNLLDDYVDAALEREDEARIRRHLAGCEACRAEERSLRALLEHAATLPESIDPPRDLWPDIDGRLDEIEPPASADRPWPTARPRFWVYGLIAASLLVAGLAGGYLLRGPVSQVGVAPVASDAPTTTTSAEVVAAEQAIVQAKQQLQALLDGRQGSLSPATVKMVDENLALIDQAIDEIRGALREDPANQRLNRKLLNAHQRQLHLLQRATQIAARGTGSDTI